MKIRHFIIVSLAVLSGICFGVALSTHLLVTGSLGSTWRAYVVQSGSMEPAIKTGSIVITKSADQFSVGDVITFAPPGFQDKLITHRISSIQFESGDTSNPIIKTKGDANEENDPYVINSERIVGKEYLTVPFLGYISNFVRTPKGFVALVVIPASIIIYEEIKSIFKEIFGFIRKKRGKNRSFDSLPAQAGAQDDNGSNMVKTGVLIPVMGAALLMVSASGAYFFDQERAEQNILGAAVNFGEENEQVEKIVINEIYQSSTNSEEWIELYNAGNTDINIKNYTIGDLISADVITSEDFILSPGEFVVVGASAAVQTNWSIAEGEFINLDSLIGSGLNTTGDTVFLTDDAAAVLDEVEFGEIENSIERDPDGTDTDNISDFVERAVPTPGS